ncbi:MAG: hypothetical protein IIU35_03345 [Neisseriaceae bacterium]|nr:hypothetical protein [Neisseriaceae bacterium]
MSGGVSGCLKTFVVIARFDEIKSKQSPNELRQQFIRVAFAQKTAYRKNVFRLPKLLTALSLLWIGYPNGYAVRRLLRLLRSLAMTI